VKKSIKTGVKSNRPAIADRGAVTVLHPVIPTEFGDVTQHKRILEALLFAASEPLDEESLAARLPQGADVPSLLLGLEQDYSDRGVGLVRVAGKWALRTAEDLRFLMQREAIEQKRLSKAALETLAIIAYHQPATRAEIEAVRGVTISKGTLDVLLEMGWIRMRGRRRSPGRPVTYGTTDHFLNHFGLDTIGELPGLSELKGAGLLDGNLPPDFEMPMPNDDLLGPDEDPLDEEEDYLSQPLLDLDET
jgi:segregation and condensation protein B